MALAAKHDLIMELSDVTSAFLEAVLHHEVWVEQPQGYENGNPGHACKLNKALYGLKQASHEWYETLYNKLKEHGFRRIEEDHSIFINDHTGVIIGAYVDDLLILARNRTHITAIKSVLDTSFRFKHLGDVSEYLGMEIVRNTKARELHMNQKKYVRQLLSQLGMEQCRPAKSPMEQAYIKPTPEDYKATKDDITAYQSLIGALNWISIMTRPDITLAVSRLAKYNQNPTAEHMQAAKRVVRYLAGTIDVGITFKPGDDDGVQEYTDTSWNDNKETSRSTGGYLYKLHNGPISWSSKQQKLIATSSAESEYMAAFEALKEGLFVTALIRNLGFHEGEFPINLAVDNQSAITLASNPSNHSATKHIRLRYHYIRELVGERKEMVLRWVDTKSQCADPLTKPLGPISCGTARDLLGLALGKI